jgi:hypothetical protein
LGGTFAVRRNSNSLTGTDERPSRDLREGRYAVPMPSAVIVLVYALAVARVTRLVNADRITETPRAWLLDRLWTRAAPWVPAGDRERADLPLSVYLVTCPWCVSIYVGLVAAPLVYFLGENPIFLIPALALAFSQVVGLLAQVGD